MRFSDNFRLPCLDGTDYGAYALYMGCLAEMIDAELTAQSEAFDAFLNRPTGIWTRTTTQTGINFGSNDPLFLFETLTLINWPTLTALPQIPITRGWYHIGMTANFIASGAVNADTVRRLRLSGDAVINDEGATVAGYVDLQDQVWESNTGNGENLSVQGTVFQPGFAVISLLGSIFHGNTGSSLTMTITPPPRIWVTYLGDTPEIAQVG